MKPVDLLIYTLHTKINHRVITNVYNSVQMMRIFAVLWPVVNPTYGGVFGTSVLSVPRQRRVIYSNKFVTTK